MSDAAPDSAGTGIVIEKVMTLSQSEYAKSISAFAGEAAGQAAARGEPVTLPAGAGEVTITFTKIDGFSFSGLLELPRARVVLTFNNVQQAAADELLHRFDIAFQRGGG